MDEPCRIGTFGSVRARSFRRRHAPRHSWSEKKKIRAARGGFVSSHNFFSFVAEYQLASSRLTKPKLGRIFCHSSWSDASMHEWGGWLERLDEQAWLEAVCRIALLHDSPYFSENAKWWSQTTPPHVAQVSGFFGPRPHRPTARSMSARNTVHIGPGHSRTPALDSGSTCVDAGPRGSASVDGRSSIRSCVLSSSKQTPPRGPQHRLLPSTVLCTHARTCARVDARKASCPGAPYRATRERSTVPRMGWDTSEHAQA